MPPENQPLPDAIQNQRNCTNCAFSIEARMRPEDIRSQLICRWGPPQMVAVFTPQGVQIQVMQVPVSEAVLCNQHHFRAEIVNANLRPTEGPSN